MKKRIISLVVLVIALMLSVACTSTDDGGSNSTGLAADATIKITGAGLDLTLTADDMAAMTLETISTQNVSSTGEVSETEIKAISLSGILSENGVELSEIANVDLVASDGYVMSATQAEYGDSDIYIILEENGEQLEYPRSGIPEQRAMFWVKLLSEIHLGDSGSANAENPAVNEVSIFVEEVKDMISENVSDGETEYVAYSNARYLEIVFGNRPTSNLTLKAEDGMERSETADIFLDNYVSIDEAAEDTPLYYGSDISMGMKIKSIKYAIAGSKAVYYGSGISLQDLFDEVGMEEASTYKLVAADGFESEVPAEAIAHGEIVLDGDTLETDFGDYDMSGIAGKGSVKNIVKIIAVN